MSASLSAALPPCSIQVTETTYTEITVQWGSCAVVVNSYELTIEPNSANAPPGNVPIGGNFEYTFNSLVPGQRYIVGIRSTGSTEPYATDSVFTGRVLLHTHELIMIIIKVVTLIVIVVVIVIHVVVVVITVVVHWYTFNSLVPGQRYIIGIRGIPAPQNRTPQTPSIQVQYPGCSLRSLCIMRINCISIGLLIIEHQIFPVCL